MSEQELTTREDASVASMLQTAMASGQSPEILERLFALYERMEANKAEKALSAALAGFQAACPFIAKTTPADRYKYEHIADVAAAIKPYLAPHSLSYSFDFAYPDEKHLDTTCTIRHKDGAQTTCTVRMPLESTLKGLSPAQKSGAAMTYAQRRALEGALGITPGNDTDGAVTAETISEAQAAELAKIGQDLPSALWARMFIWAGTKDKPIDNIIDLPLSKYQEAKRTLVKEAAKMEKGAAQ